MATKKAAAPAPKSKEVAVAKSTAVSTEVATPDLGEWGLPELSQKDTVISKILPMQLTSKLVIEGKASFGQLVDSVTHEIVGSIQKPIEEFIPFFMQRNWQVSEKEGGAWVYKKSVPVNSNATSPDYNDNWPYEEEINGVEIKRVRTMDFFVLFPDDIESDSALPKIISFRSTSLRAGKKLATQMYVANRSSKKGPAAVAMKLIASKQTNDKGAWVIFDVDVARDATPLEQAKALEWFKTVNAGAVKVHDTEEEVSSATASPSGGEEY